MISPYETACAGGILRREQEKGEARSGAYGRALRRTRDAKAPGPSGCAVTGARGVASLGRWHRIALRGAPGGPPRHGATQSIPYGEIML